MAEFDRELLAAEKDFDRAVEVEALLLHVIGTIQGVMTREGVHQAELARRLGVSRARVTQMLGGDGNPTLRTVAEVLYELGYYLECKAVRK